MSLRSMSLVVLALSAGLGAACAKDQPPAPSQSATPTTVVTAPAVTRIEDPSLVCMVNDLYMGKAHIPVAVDGKTYFGCCPACKGRLETEAEVRTALDPVSGEPVDKATAVLAQDADGKVLYFASVDTMSRYRP